MNIITHSFTFRYNIDYLFRHNFTGFSFYCCIVVVFLNTSATNFVPHPYLNLFLYTNIVFKSVSWQRIRTIQAYYAARKLISNTFCDANEWNDCVFIVNKLIFPRFFSFSSFGASICCWICCMIYESLS